MLLVRHGPAGDKLAWAAKGRPDSERPLTKDGREKTKMAMRGLARMGPRPDVLATSPLARAFQTAELLEKALKRKKKFVLTELSPSASPAQAVRVLPDEGVVAVVGHEPHLSRMMARCLGLGKPIGELKKGGAALIEFEGKALAGRGRLRWLLTPSQLRVMGVSSGK